MDGVEVLAIQGPKTLVEDWRELSVQLSSINKIIVIPVDLYQSWTPEDKGQLVTFMM